MTELKKDIDATTFEELIVKLIEKTKKIPKNMFGIDKKIKPFTEKDELEFEGEQD